MMRHYHQRLIERANAAIAKHGASVPWIAMQRDFGYCTIPALVACLIVMVFSISGTASPGLVPLLSTSVAGAVYTGAVYVDAIRRR